MAAALMLKSNLKFFTVKQEEGAGMPRTWQLAAGQVPAGVWPLMTHNRGPPLITVSSNEMKKHERGSLTLGY